MHKSDQMINISIIGLGRVGAALLSNLIHCDAGLNLNVVDPSPEIMGALLDNSHAANLYPHHDIFLNDRDLLIASDFIFHAAGHTTQRGESRLRIGEQNIVVTREIFENTQFEREPFVIVITNPVDVVTFHTWKASGLPPEKVIGTGTLLDTIRLDYYLAQLLGRSSSEVNSWVLGEHGQSLVPVFSQTRIGNTLLKDYDLSPDILEQAVALTKSAATQIRATQDRTYWGVAHCAYKLFCLLRQKTPKLLPAGVRLSDHYRKKLATPDLYMSLPAFISDQGYTVDNDFALLEKEWEMLKVSSGILQAHL